MIENYADHAANERTFLAWVRTAIAIVGFGMVTARLDGARAAFWSEGLLLAAGGLVVLLAWIRMRHVKTRISAKGAIDDNAVPGDTLLLLTVAALFGLLGSFVIHAG